jgi:hypothetical protein
VLTPGRGRRYLAPVADTPALVNVELVTRFSQSWAGAFLGDPMAGWGLRPEAGDADLRELFGALLVEYVPGRSRMAAGRWCRGGGLAAAVGNCAVR